ncbi:MAG: zona occludens toxin [Rhodocyclaceae bacterium]|nr:MAG: zona occludens toxin [Rhodocyclaceae bacterium]TND01878.1 MAG: zona occludens toxin [Rhodocyclaceae bacterium]
MSIKAYVGRMGSGKTYEVVASVIVPALARGRRVVSNIAGLDADEIRGLLVEQGVALDQIGELVQITHDDVIKPEFWRTDKDQAEGVDSFIQPGDLVALDEIWRFWEGFAGRKMPERVMNFYRMHRHFTHPETGVACDVAIITQDVLDIARKVRAVIEETYGMEKLTAIGSTKRYRVDVFQGTRTSRRPLRQLQRTYDPRFFPLYSSHSQKKEGDADAVEENIDKRGNILKGALFKLVLPVGLVVAIFAVYTVYSFFNPKPKDKPAAVAKASESKPGDVSHAKPSVDVSDEWRAAGYFVTPAGVGVYLIQEGRARMLHNPPSYRLVGSEVETFLPSGQAVASWSGSRPAGLVPGTK